MIVRPRAQPPRSMRKSPPHRQPILLPGTGVCSGCRSKPLAQQALDFSCPCCAPVSPTQMPPNRPEFLRFCRVLARPLGGVDDCRRAQPNRSGRDTSMRLPRHFQRHSYSDQQRPSLQHGAVNSLREKRGQWRAVTVIEAEEAGRSSCRVAVRGVTSARPGEGRARSRSRALSRARNRCRRLPAACRVSCRS